MIDGVIYLKKYGNFSLDEINNLTLGQMREFMKAITKMVKIDIKENIIANLAGARYDQDSLTQLLKELEI